MAARAADSEDPKIAAALRFAAKIVAQRGQLPASEERALRAASDGQVADIIAAVALNIYRSHFNLIARPKIDFPVVATRGSPAALRRGAPTERLAAKIASSERCGVSASTRGDTSRSAACDAGKETGDG